VRSGFSDSRGRSQARAIKFMVLGEHRLTIPTNAEYSVPQLRFMLREVEILIGRSVTLEEWTNLTAGTA
jgi:hypothetical protein